MAGARHAGRQGDGAVQEPAPAPAQPPGAAARLRGRVRRDKPLRPGRADGRAAEGRARAQPDRRAAQRLQARHAAAPSVHELPGGRRAWPPAGHGPAPGHAEGRAGRPGAVGLPGVGGAEAGQRGGGACTRTAARTTGSGRPTAGGESRRPTAAARCASGPHRLDLRCIARADGNPQGRPGADRLPGADRQGRACRDRGLRRARRSCAEAPRRPAPAGGAGHQGAAEVPGEEHPRPGEDGHAVHAAGQCRRAAQPDHCGGAGPRLPGRPAAGRCRQLRQAHHRRPRPAEPDRAGGGAPGWRDPHRVRHRPAQAEGQPARQGGGRRRDSPAAAAGAQAFPAGRAVCPARALRALPQGGDAAAGQVARRPRARRAAPGRVAADRAALHPPPRRSEGRGRRPAG